MTPLTGAGPVRPGRVRRLAWRRALAALAAVGVLAGVAAAVTVPEVDVEAAERNPTKLEPDPLDILRAPQKFSGSARRHIVLRPEKADLLQGAAVVDSVPLNGRAATLEVVAAAVARSKRPDWLTQTQPGVYLLRVALAQAQGTRLTVAAPAVRQLRLLAAPDVYIAAVGAHGIYRRVVITSWDERARRPDPDAGRPRPFVRYGQGSILTIERSRFGYLGADRSTGAYGVTWEGASGKAAASTFHNNFVGAYTSQAHDVAFVGNAFRDNTLHGLDPHDYTTGLQVIANRAFRNGNHGIVFSGGVTGALVRQNRSYDNGANGIVMDERSNRNTITGNVVEGNDGDGIVLLGSSDVVVRHNEVRRNRVGVRVNLRSARNVVEHNLIEHNQRGIELYGGARETRLGHNQVLDSAVAAMAIEAPDSVSSGDTVSGAPIGIEVRGLASVHKPSISNVGQGIVVTSRGIATVTEALVHASDAGVHVQPGGLARVTTSRLNAPRPFSGAEPRRSIGNSLVKPASALPWLAFAGAAFLVLAVLLQVVHRTRNRPASLRKEGAAGVWTPS